jgi:hypothetical protein
LDSKGKNRKNNSGRRNKVFLRRLISTADFYVLTFSFVSKMPFIIDGYNLLHSIQKSDEHFAGSGDVLMCKVLNTFLRRNGEKGQIIFDGIGPPEKSGFENLSNLEVIFSGPRIEADEVVEDKIKTSSAPKGLTIVSDDRRLRAAAKKSRAASIKCQAFWRSVLEQTKSKPSPKEPREKRFGITEGETEQWLEFFNLEQ